nr:MULTISPECIES: DUF982 domain-containing protein [unclassified Mesorhizobium]
MLPTSDRPFSTWRTKCTLRLSAAPFLRSAPHTSYKRSPVLPTPIDLLEEWPEECRNIIHETALKACYDAYDGRKPLSAAPGLPGLRQARRYIGRSDLRHAVDWRLQIGHWKTVG